MTDLTDYSESEIMNWFFGNDQMPTPPASVFVHLHTGDPGENADANHVAAADYDPVEVTNPGGWTIAGSNVENANEINFGTATSAWGAVSHFSVWDSADTGTGNPLWKSALGSSKTIEENDELRFDAGALTASID